MSPWVSASSSARSGVQAFDGLAAVLAVGEVVVHVGAHRPRPVQGHEGADVVETCGRQRAHEGPHGTALELEDPDRVAPPQHLEDLLVVERYVVNVGAGSHGVRALSQGRRLDEVEGALHHREVAQAQKVHLQESEVGHAVHLVLGHDGRVGGVATRLGLALDGEILGEGLARDDHGRGVDAVLATQALEPARHLDHLPGVGVGLVDAP